MPEAAWVGGTLAGRTSPGAKKAHRPAAWLAAGTHASRLAHSEQELCASFIFGPAHARLRGGPREGHRGFWERGLRGRGFRGCAACEPAVASGGGATGASAGPRAPTGVPDAAIGRLRLCRAGLPGACPSQRALSPAEKGGPSRIPQTSLTAEPSFRGVSRGTSVWRAPGRRRSAPGARAPPWGR